MSIVVRLAVGLLERSNDPDLQEIAKWVKDAEGRVVDLVLDALGQSLKTTGGVDAAKAQLNQIRSSANGMSTDPLDSWSTTTPWLVEQARIVRTIAALAAWRRAIYLKGFFHDANCTSLWHFPTDEALIVQVANGVLGEPELPAIGRQIRVYLLPPLDVTERNAMNRSIGANYSAWLPSANVDALPHITTLTEDVVSISEKFQVTQTNRRGGVTTKSETKVTKTPISQREAAFDELLDSLPGAIEARDRDLHQVRSKLK